MSKLQDDAPAAALGHPWQPWQHEKHLLALDAGNGKAADLPTF